MSCFVLINSSFEPLMCLDHVTVLTAVTYYVEVVAVVRDVAVAAVAVLGLFLFHRVVETTMRYIFTFVSCQSG